MNGQGQTPRAAIAALMQADEIGPEAVRALQRLVIAAGAVTRAEADALFALEASTVAKPADWTAFFVEAITDHVVWDERPTGIVDEASARWLVAQVDRTGSMGALAALVNIMAEAHRVPAWLLAEARSRAARAMAAQVAA